jgi:outer membrane receptor protein involved in Fe transport
MFRSLLLLVFTGTSLTFSQNPPGEGSVSGFVTDASNGETLIGANVFLQGTRMGASTNLRGYYVIPRVPAGNYTLIVQYIGYRMHARAITVSEGESKVVRISLQPESLAGEEVVIYADSVRTIEKMFEQPVSKIELSGEQINRIPQVAEADLLRSLQTLPGIVPVSDFSSALYVRGGTPDQNLYLIDGSDVYNPEHAFGIFSTFNTDAIKQVELSKGGFGAQYGGRLSSVLHVTNLDGNRREVEGSGSVSLLSAKTTIQMPLGDFGSVSGSIRRTYFDKTVGQAVDEIPDYYFYDGNVKTFVEIDPHNTLTISGYGGRDVLHFHFNEDADDKAGFDYTWGNQTGSLRWSHVFNPRWFGNFWISASTFRSDFAFDESVNFSEENFISDITFKGSLEYHHSGKFISRFGFEQKNLHGIYREDFESGRVDVNARRRHYVGFFEETWRPSDRWNIEAGVRMDYFDSERDFKNIDPRALIKYKLNETTNLKAAAGVYHQYLHQIPRAFFVGIWTTSDNFQKGSTAYHALAGVDRELGPHFQLQAEVYYKQYRDIYSLNHFLITTVKPARYEDGEPVYANTQGLFNRGDGYSTGFEVLVRKDIGNVTGWLGYSLASTKYSIDGINDDRSFAPRHDRSHTVNMVGNLEIRNTFRALRGRPPVSSSSKWTFGWNLIYSSGQPITLAGSSYLIRTTPDDDDGRATYPGEINGYRLPHYARLDVSLIYEKTFKSWSLAPYLQIFNVGARRNVWFIQYTSEDQAGQVTQKIKTFPMFPLIPSIGANFKF